MHTMKKDSQLLNKKRRESISQLSRNLATFWLTAVPIALFSNFGTDNGIIVPLIGTLVAGTSFAILSVFIHKDDDKPQEQMHTEIKKGIFHVGNAEIKH